MRRGGGGGGGAGYDLSNFMQRRGAGWGGGGGGPLTVGVDGGHEVWTAGEHGLKQTI